MSNPLGVAMYRAKVARHVKPVVVNTPELQLMLEVQKRDFIIEQLNLANEDLAYRIRNMKLVHENLIRDIAELKKSMFKMASLRRIPLNVTASVPEAAEASGATRGPAISEVMAASLRNSALLSSIFSPIDAGLWRSERVRPPRIFAIR